MTRLATEPLPPTARDGSRALLIGSLGVFVALVAFTTALGDAPVLADALGAGARSQVWILSSMSVGLAGSLLVAGTLADDYGRRRIFVLGAALLACGSVVCAVAPVAVVFVLGRLLEGVGGGALIATSLAMTSTFFTEPAARGHAGAIWGASLSAGVAVGPLVPAVLDPIGSWRWTYLLLTVLGLLVAGLGSRLRETQADHRRALDLVGLVTFAGTMTLVLSALVESREATHPLVPVLLAVGAVLLGAVFVTVERRRREPMLDLGLFRRRDFALTTVAGLAAGLGVIAVMSYGGTYLIAGLGASTLVSGSAMLGWAATATAVSLVARRVPSWLLGTRQLAIGLLGCAAGLLLLAALAPQATVASVLPGFVLAGLGTGLLNAGLGREAVASAPPGRGGLGSGVNNTARYLGSAIGVTVVSVLAGPHVASGDPAVGWQLAALVTAGVTAAAGLLILVWRPDRRAVSPSA